jgi:hypothetical protein
LVPKRSSLQNQGRQAFGFKGEKEEFKADVKAADIRIEAMKGQSAYACSGRFFDEDNFLLAAVFANNFLSTTSKPSSSHPSASISVRLA